MPELGYTVGNTVQSMAFSTNAKIKQKYTIWGINVNQKDPITDIKYSTKLSKAIRKTKALKYKKGWVNIDSVSEIEPSSFLDDNKYIYDITTDTHSFICNNIWVHNCVSVSLYPFLLNGLKDLGGSASAPTHADSYIGGLCNLIFLVAGQFAGAVAIPEFLTYFDHFIRKDFGDDYINHLDEDIYAFGTRHTTLS